MPYLSSAERRAVILDAAVEVIAEEGLAGATTRRIAERAQSPLGALHYCFRGKDELMSLVLERGAASMRAAFDDIDPSTGVEETLRASALAYWRWIRDNLGLHLALMELLMWTIRRSTPGKALYASVTNPYGGDLLRANLEAAASADGVELATRADDLARFMVHRFDGLTLEYAVSRDRVGCERQVELLIAAVLTFTRPEIRA